MQLEYETLVDCLINASHTIGFGLCCADTLRSGQIDKHGRGIYNLLCWYSFTGLILTSSVSGRNACFSEEVTFTCTAQGDTLFWGNEEFGEITMYYTSPRSGDEFRAEIVSYDTNKSCLTSSLSFRASASRNGTTVTCTSRDRSSDQSLSLHIMQSKFILLTGFYVAEMYTWNRGGYWLTSACVDG